MSLGLFHAGRIARVRAVFRNPGCRWPGLYVGGAGIDLSWGRIIELASGPGRRGNVAQR